MNKHLVVGLNLVLCLIVANCHPQPKPDDSGHALAACSLTMEPPTPQDVCGTFTDDGHACVNCKNAGGCIDKADEVYCVFGSCMTDPACHSAQAESKKAKLKGTVPVEVCSDSMKRPTITDLCGRFTSSGYACVKCPNALGCMDIADQVYCARTCSDKLCGPPRKPPLLTVPHKLARK